ncbi:MAG: FecR domain-containing protein, partial [Flammeovirgaceae bacterium]|nr:FecR domain-containing protein [Flammeovirgaceae bacterium]
DANCGNFTLLIASGFIIINYFVFTSHDIQFETADNTLGDNFCLMAEPGNGLTAIRNWLVNPIMVQERRVRIKGEGFFDVERNPQKTFVIEINKATVEVLGTPF